MSTVFKPETLRTEIEQKPTCPTDRFLGSTRPEFLDQAIDPAADCLSSHLDRGRIVVFIDGANLFYAASQMSVEIDYCKLLAYLSQGGRLLHAFFYTGFIPDNDKQHKFLMWMQRSGFRVITKAVTQCSNGAKKANLDVEIAVDMMRLADYFDTAILVSGDGDFAYVLNTLAYQGVRVEVVGLRSMTSDQLINVADCYTDLSSLKQEIQKLAYTSDPALSVSNASQNLGNRPLAGECRRNSSPHNP